MSTQKKDFTLKVHVLSRMSDPRNKRACHIDVFVKVTDMPTDISTEKNIRPFLTDGEGGAKPSGIYKKMLADLLDNSLDFHNNNRGIRIIAESASVKGESIVLRGASVVDGGHTYMVIKEALKQKTVLEQFVKITIVQGLSNKKTKEMVVRNNTNVQVKEKSISNYTGRFAFLKTNLNTASYGSKISYVENESSKVVPLNVLDIVAMMNLFNIKRFDGETSPAGVYSHKAAALKHYNAQLDTFKKMSPIIKDILFLSDYLNELANVKLKNKTENKKIKPLLGIKKRGTHTFHFTGGEGKIRLNGGVLYPMLASFRCLVEFRKGEYRWKRGIGREKLKKLAEQRFDAMIKTSANLNKPSHDVGRDISHWNALYASMDAVTARMKL